MGSSLHGKEHRSTQVVLPSSRHRFMFMATVIFLIMFTHWTLGEQSKKLFFLSSDNLQNKFLVLCSELHQVVVKHKVSK
jgi:hypothetical protein